MKHGDILLIKYKLDPIGLIIRIFTCCKWNHSAWVINNKLIFDPKAKLVKIIPIDKYLNKRRYELKVVRIKNLSSEKMAEAIRYSFRYLGNHSYCQFLLSLIGILFRIKKMVKITCSGIIADSLSKVGFYFKKNKNPFYITPDDINNSRSVENV